MLGRVAAVDDRPDPQQVARRVRAAQAYAKLSRNALASAIGMSPSNLDFMTGKRRGRLRGASWDELRAIGCGSELDVPRLVAVDVPPDVPYERVLSCLDDNERAGVFDRTAFFLVADHGMEESNPEVTGDWGPALDATGIPYRDEAYMWIYTGVT